MRFTMKGLSLWSLSSKSAQMKLNRTVHNIKLTLLCGVVTVLIMHGTVGRSSVVVSLVPEAPEVEFKASWFPVEEEEEKAKVYWDPAVPFQLGPKVFDWDKQRLLWNRAHPEANSTRSGAARVLLVTGYQPKPCANPQGSFQLLKSLKNKADYCRLHSIELFYNMAHLDPHMTSFWAKLPLLRKLMLAHPEAEWLWWMDSDALFADMSVEVPLSSYENYNLVMNGNEADVYKKKSWLGLNAGIFLIRNCQWSLDLLDVWAQMGPEGPVRNNGGKLLAASLSDRPDFEADDQSALVHLLNAERQRWGDKVMLEGNLGLHGYWAFIVEKYEEMMVNGLGKWAGKWPFVTHFVGCKPCGKDGSATYAEDRCLHHMDRAFNFADNQILQMYGYRHNSLNQHAVHNVHVESSDPLGAIHDSKSELRLSLA